MCNIENFFRLRMVLLFVFLQLSWTGCGAPSKPVDETPAMEEAILSYLTSTKSVRTDQMTLTIESTQIEGDAATCKASFSLKNVQGMQPISYKYRLRKVSNKWSVESSEPLSIHGTTDQK